MASLLFPKWHQFELSTGAPAASYWLHFLTTGTSTAKDAYSDVDATTPIANPYQLNSAGRPAANIYISGEYRVVLHSTNDLLTGTSIADVDPVEDSIRASELPDLAAPLGFSMHNGKLAASVASGALTISIKTNAGTDPTVASPVYVIFRNVTEATGDYSYLTISAATSLVISQGSNLGHASAGGALRIWIVGFNDAGTFRIGVINCVRTNAEVFVRNIYPLGQLALASSTAEGGGGNADTAGTFYTGTAVTSKPYAVLGYMEWDAIGGGGGGLGDYTAVPDTIQLFHPGVPLPGRPIQEAIDRDSVVQTGTTTVPADSSAPTSTEGDQFFSVTITPTSKANVLEFDAEFYAAASANGTIAASIFSSTTNLGTSVSLSGINVIKNYRMTVVRQSAVNASTAYNLRIGNSAAGTLTLNGEAAAQLYSDRLSSYFRVKEIQG